jgi:hypothetical protein
VAVGIVVTYAVGFWLLSARKWFKGPVRQIEAGWYNISCVQFCTNDFAEQKGLDIVDQGVMEAKVDTKDSE